MTKKNELCKCGSNMKTQLCCGVQSTNSVLNSEDLYNMALFYMNNGNLGAAIKSFKSVIKMKAPNQLKSAACVTIASIVMNTSEENKDEIIQYYLKEALTFNPVNTMVPSIYTQYFMLTMNFSKAVNWYDKCETEQAINDVDIIFGIILNTIQKKYISQPQKFEELLTSEGFMLCIESFVKKTHNDELLIDIGNILTILYLNLDREYKLFLQKILLLIYEKNPNSLTINQNLGRLYYKQNLNSLKSSLKYFNKALTLADSQEGNEDLELIKQNIKSNIGSTLINSNKYQEVIDLLEPIILVNPNNTDMHNLAIAYMYSNNYEKSIDYLKRCLFMQEDESSLKFLALNYYKLEIYVEAIKYYNLALNNLKSQNIHFLSNDLNGELLNSYTYEEHVQDHYLDIYQHLINCYIFLEDYIEAKIIYEEASTMFPYDQMIASSKLTIDAFLKKNMKSNEIELEVQKVKSELLAEKISSEKNTIKFKNWAVKLLEIQNKKSNLNEINDDDFYKKLDSIILDMKSENHNQQLYKKCVEEILTDFNHLNKKSKEFLATANYLLEINSGTVIDFAPILIEYVKVFENEFRTKQRIRTKRMTLGNMLVLIEDKKITPYLNYLSELKYIGELRNAAAHIGQSNENHVREIKDIILELLYKIK